MSFWEEPTFTLEEFIYSWHPHNIVPTNIEQMMYFNIKAGMIVGPWLFGQLILCEVASRQPTLVIWPVRIRILFIDG